MKKLCSLLYSAGGTRFVAWCNPGNVEDFCRCDVTQRDHRGPTDPDGLKVNLRGFAAQLAILARQYRLVSLQTYFETGRGLPDNRLLLSVGDGFRNFLAPAVAIPPARAFPSLTVQANRNSSIPRGGLAAARLNLC